MPAFFLRAETLCRKQRIPSKPVRSRVMPMKNGAFAVLFLALCSAAMGQSDFTLTGIVPEPGQKTALDVNYTGAFPRDPSAYMNKDAWRVWVKRPYDTKAAELEVTSVEKIESTSSRSTNSG